jgi:uncharacterized protein
MYRSIEKDLKSWKNQQDRKPLLLRGARQIGKSYTVEKFGKENFTNLVLINFEINKIAHTSFESLEPAKIIQSLALTQQVSIEPGKTLLFLDEIQECPNAITALRYFKERLPELHVIAAGSLLEFTLNEEAFHMPVGRVESLYMKPCSFTEFLTNTDDKALTDYLETATLQEGIDQAIHLRLLEKLREYFILGGMPEVLSSYKQHKDFQRCQKIQAALFESYPRDFGKYGKKVNAHNLQAIYQHIPNVIAQRFIYSHVNADIPIRDLKPALQSLIYAGLVYPLYQTAASGLPFNATMNAKKFKLLFLDIGLCKYSSELDAQIYTENDLVLLDKGTLAEQFVGQELLAYKENYRQSSLYYWEREKAGSSAEVDFVINVGSKIYPLEVKSGKTGRLKSLQVFMNEKNLKYGVRISQHPLGLDKNILSVPLYMISQLPRIIQEL